ncbi:MAG: xanthine dehydrogenase accessory protein XdhC [Burkholderiales bacterium]|nr:xanthine dehydrogenase accessory protein XdhC [Burkholderiales bacterium]
MADWVAELGARIARGERAVLVTVANAAGSTPREAGAAMIVGARDTSGSIGGGHLEYEATRVARAALHDGAAAPWLVRFPLAARLGQCCGGVATVAFAVADSGSGGWLDAAVACARTGAAMALVTRIGGADDMRAHMVVTADHAAGTLGGDLLDSAAVAAARPRLLARKADTALVPSPAGDGTTLFVHVVVPSELNVLVFGNGHVGRALVQVLAALPARVTWVDAREEDFPASVPGNVGIVATDLPEAELDAAPRGAYVVIATHSHGLDLTLVTAALARDDWRYLGLIGSRSKRSQFEKRLLARGCTPERLARITCPIGHPGRLAIHSKEPGAIAIATAAEMLAVREQQKVGSDPTYLGEPFRRGRGSGV